MPDSPWGAVVAESVQRRHGGADVGALAVVECLDLADQAHRLHAMRLAGVLAQGVQQRRERAADRRGQRQRRERIGGVVTAAHAQRVGGHQALEVDLLFGIAPGIAGPPQDA